MKSNKQNSYLLLIHTHGINYHIYSNNSCDPIVEWHFNTHSNSILGSFIDYRDEKAKCYIFQIPLQLDIWIWLTIYWTDKYT